MANDYKQPGAWKRWIVIYIIAAVVIYGLIYYFYTHRNNSIYGNGQTNSSGY